MFRRIKENKILFGVFTAGAIVFLFAITLYFVSGKERYAGRNIIEIKVKNVYPGKESIFVDGHGNIYISDNGTSKIYKYDKAGKVAGVFEVGGKGLFLPAGMTAGKDKNLYVWDLDKEMRVFSENRVLIKSIPLSKEAIGKCYIESGVLFREADGVPVSENYNSAFVTTRQKFMKYLMTQKLGESFFVNGGYSVGWYYNSVEFDSDNEKTLKGVKLDFIDENGVLFLTYEYLDLKDKQIKYRICRISNAYLKGQINCTLTGNKPVQNSYTIDKKGNVYELVKETEDIRVVKWERKKYLLF